MGLGHNITEKHAEWDITAVITPNNYIESFITPPSASLYRGGRFSSCLVRNVGKALYSQREKERAGREISDEASLCITVSRYPHAIGLEKKRKDGWVEGNGMGADRRAQRERVEIGVKTICESAVREPLHPQVTPEFN